MMIWRLRLFSLLALLLVPMAQYHSITAYLKGVMWQVQLATVDSQGVGVLQCGYHISIH
jgi:hypothetical protein